MVTVNYTQDITFLLFPEGRSAFSAHLILINLHRDSAHIRHRRRRARMPWDNAVIDECGDQLLWACWCFQDGSWALMNLLQHQVGELKVDTDSGSVESCTDAGDILTGTDTGHMITWLGPYEYLYFFSCIFLRRYLTTRLHHVDSCDNKVVCVASQ